MINRSNVTKTELTYDEQLFDLYAAPGCVPQVRLWNFISMKPCITMNAVNLFYVTLRHMLSFFDHNFERTIYTNIDAIVIETAKHGHKNVGAGDIYLHSRNSSKEQSSMQKIGKINNFLIKSIQKPFETQFVVHVKNALAVIRTIWAALIIHFSNEKATINDKQAAGYLKQCYFNFECYVEFCAFEDLL